MGLENKRRAPPIGARLGLLVFTCVVPAVLSAIWLIVYDFQRERDRLVRDSQARTRAVVSSVDREFTSVQAALNALATSPYLTSGDFRSFHAQAAEVLQEMRASHIVLTDSAGQQIVNTRVSFGEPLPQHGNIAVVRRLFETGQPVVSDLFTDKASGAALFTVAVPVRRDAKVVYDLAASISPLSLTSILAQHNFPEDWIVALLDSTGTTMARSHQIDRFLGKKAVPQVLERLLVQREDVVESRSLEGIPVIILFTQSSSTRWTVALGIPQTLLTHDLWISVWLAVAITGLLLISGFGVAWVIGWRISDSIAELAKPAMALGYGQQVTVPPLYFREADELGEILSTASEVLNEASAAVAFGQARLRGILDSAMDAIITVDEEQHVLLFNSAAVTLFGWPLEEAIGRPLTQFLPERFRHGHGEHVKGFGRDGVTRRRMGHQSQILGLRRNGEEFPIEASISQIVEDGHSLYTVIVRDVTERVKTQQALERSNFDLQQFAYVASHDLKGPLRSISGFVQLLERSYSARLDAKGVDLLRRTSVAASRLEDLTNDLLLLAQVDSDAPAHAPVSCQEVMDEVLLLLQGPIEAAGAVVTVDTLPVVSGTRTQLVHLFLNLLSNAIKYRGESALLVKVWAEQNGPNWVICVKDNGIGIAPEHFKRIFDVFSRLHSVDQYKGTGIGLAICRRIVERHGGTIWVESDEGSGSTFRVSLAAA